MRYDLTFLVSGSFIIFGRIIISTSGKTIIKTYKKRENKEKFSKAVRYVCSMQIVENFITIGLNKKSVIRHCSLTWKYRNGAKGLIFSG